MALVACDGNSGPHQACLNLSGSQAEVLARAVAVARDAGHVTVSGVSSALASEQPSPEAWRVNVDAVEVYGSGTASLTAHWQIDVDRCSGAATIRGRN